jgi:DNA gyrase subunit A
MSEMRIEPIDVADEMSKSFLDYSMSVIISRALPDVRDGLKPSQRRILYAMHELSLYPPKKHMKCAKICGDTSGNYHPHGEAVIYPTLVNMAQPWSMRDPLVDPQGNFGSVEGDPPAAMRYTEARLSSLGGELMADMEKDTVDFVPNYDERLTEPTVFPAAFPNLLVNGGTGIAVGMATNIPPHNLGEVVNAICAQIDHPEIPVEGLMEFIKGPDFPTGCTILGMHGIHEYFRTGRGSVRVRGKVEIETDERGRERIVILEIPYNVNRATLISRIAELVNDKTLPEISGLRDLSDENTRVEIELKRDARAQVVVNNLYKLTALETSFGVNMLAIDNRRPRLLSIKDAITCYIEHRREVILRRTRYLLRRAEDRAEVLEAFLLALGNLDEFIRIIRDSRNRDEARERLKERSFDEAAVAALGILIRGQASLRDGRYWFTDRQVNAILELRLYQLTGMERDKIKAEYDAVLAEITDLLDILAREPRVLALIKDELHAIKAKHGSPRLTAIEPAAGEMNIEDFIANETHVVTLTHRGYLKRTALAEYRSQRRGGKGVKGVGTLHSAVGDEPGDFVEQLFTADAHDYLMFFTQTGRVYVERVFQIPEGGRNARGRNIRNLLNLQPDERVAATLRLERRVRDTNEPDGGAKREDVTFGEDGGYVFFATKSGRVKKTSLHEFRNHRRDGIIAINLEEGNELIDVRLTSGNDHVILVTRNGISLRFPEEQARPLGRSTAGVSGIRPEPGDHVVAFALVEESATLLVASSKGIGKRTAFDEYRVQSRGGKGIITMKLGDKTGHVVGALAVHESDQLMLITTAGQSIRIRVNEIREAGRNTMGVKLLTLGGDESLQGIARVVADDAEDNGEDAEPDPAGTIPTDSANPENPAETGDTPPDGAP